MRHFYSDDEILKMIFGAQNGNESALEMLLSIFDPLIKKRTYAIRSKLDLAISDSLHKAAMIRAAYAKKHNSETIVTLSPSLFFVDANDNSFFKFDDIYAELQVHFFKLVRCYDPFKMDFRGYIKKYMEQYEKKYIARAKLKYSRRLEIPIEPEIVCWILEDRVQPFEEDDELKVFFEQEIRKLAKSKQEVIEGYFFDGLNEEDLAKKLGKTQQSINRTKKRALKDLKSAILQAGFENGRPVVKS